MKQTLFHYGHSAWLLLKNLAFNRLDVPIVILLYHRVAEPASDPQSLAVTPPNFRSHMEFLRDNFPVIRLGDNWSEIKEPSVVITFDDGYADNVLEALPILEDVGLPATFFISTGAIGSQNGFWWDELESIILADRVFPDIFSLVDSRYSRSWKTNNASERYDMYQGLLLLMKKVDARTREAWFGQLREWAHAADSFRMEGRTMTIDELRTLAKSPLVTIGAHTVTHTPLSCLSFECQREEIVESKRWLEKHLGCKIAVFSYPFGGRHDYNSGSISICKDTGFSRVATAIRGPTHRNTSPYQLPRQLVRNWPREVFIKKMNRFWLL